MDVQPQEIRVGNWFKHKAVWSYRRSYREPVNGPFNEFNFQWDTSDWYALGESILSLESIECIPTSEVWLLKFGFTKSETYDFGSSLDKVPLYYKKDTESHNYINIVFSKNEYWYAVKVYDGGSGEEWMEVIELPYIHLIQNLYFALNKNDL